MSNATNTLSDIVNSSNFQQFIANIFKFQTVEKAGASSSASGTFPAKTTFSKKHLFWYVCFCIAYWCLRTFSYMRGRLTHKKMREASTYIDNQFYQSVRVRTRILIQNFDKVAAALTAATKNISKTRLWLSRNSESRASFWYHFRATFFKTCETISERTYFLARAMIITAIWFFQ